jgi:hypothetical protein
MTVSLLPHRACAILSWTQCHATHLRGEIGRSILLLLLRKRRRKITLVLSIDRLRGSARLWSTARLWARRSAAVGARLLVSRWTWGNWRSNPRRSGLVLSLIPGLVNRALARKGMIHLKVRHVVSAKSTTGWTKLQAVLSRLLRCIAKLHGSGARTGAGKTHRQSFEKRGGKPATHDSKAAEKGGIA